MEEIRREFERRWPNASAGLSRDQFLQVADFAHQAWMKRPTVERSQEIAEVASGITAHATKVQEQDLRLEDIHLLLLDLEDEYGQDATAAIWERISQLVAELR